MGRPPSVNMDCGAVSCCSSDGLPAAVPEAAGATILYPLPPNSLSFLTALYTEVIYRPLLNGLVGIYSLLPYRDLGLAIIVLTVVVRLLLHPSIAGAIRSQQAMARIGPRLRAVQERLKSDREALARETMALYRAEGVHPLSGCLPLLIQLPVLIGLYQVFWKGILLDDRSLLYSFLPALDAFNPIAFGIFNLARPNLVLAIAAGISQFLHSRLLPQPQPSGSSPGDFGAIMQWQARYVFPLIIAGISWSLPSALAFYWTAFNLLAILHQRLIEWSAAYEHNSRSHQPNAREDGHPG